MSAVFSNALLVEDEPNLATTLKVALSKLGIQVEHVTSLKDAEISIHNTPPPLLLLDRSLPDGDGITLCRSLRKENFKGMILMLTAHGETSDRVSGLNAGADDYLPKPFSWPELEARIHALYRRAGPSKPKELLPASTALWALDLGKLRILGPNGWITLTPLEFKLASRLIQSKGTIVTREELLKDVWGFTLLPKTRTVDHFLGRLRKYFEINPEDPKHFLTVRGAGYRFEPS